MLILTIRCVKRSLYPFPFVDVESSSRFKYEVEERIGFISGDDVVNYFSLAHGSKKRI